MAYIIFNDQNSMFKFAENDTQKNNMNVSLDIYNIKTITTEQFNKLKKNRSSVSLSNDTVVFTDKDPGNFDREEDLKLYHGQIIHAIKEFIKYNATAHPMYTPCNNYKQVLESFEYSSITPNEEGFYLPEKTWEEYCDDNSITYLNILQIP